MIDATALQATVASILVITVTSIFYDMLFSKKWDPRGKVSLVLASRTFADTCSLDSTVLLLEAHVGQALRWLPSSQSGGLTSPLLLETN